MWSKFFASPLRFPLPVLLLFFCAIIFIATAFEPSILDNADATHAVAAREILQRSDWVTLHVNGVRYLQKAPLLYWLVANSYQILGFNAFAVRFPSMLAVVLLVGVTYFFGQWVFSKKVGLYAAAMLGFCIGMFLFTRIMIPEALLTLLLTLGHLCFLLAFSGKGKRLYYGFYAAAALAVLTKGLIGVIFAIVPAFGFLVVTGNLARWRELKLLSGTGLFLAIAAPWHILAGLQNDHFWWYYFVNEHFLRFLGLRYPKDYNKIPFVLYWPLHFIWLFPWSAGFPLLVKQEVDRWRQFQSRRGSQKSEPNAAVRDQAKPKRWPFRLDPSALILPASPSLYLWLWAGTILIFFSLSSSMEYYTFPAYPALALLLGRAWVTAETDPQGQRWLLWINGGLAILGMLVAVVLGFLVWSTHRVQETGDFSDLLNQQATESEKYTFALGHFLDLTPQAFAALEAPAIGAALVLWIGFLLALGWRRRGQHLRTVAVMTVSMGLLFVCANIAQRQFDPILSSRFIADAIQQNWQPSAKIVLNESFEVGGSVAFYTDQRVLLLNGRNLLMDFGSRYPDVPPIFITDEDLQRLWQGDDRIFLFTEDSEKDSLLQRLGLPVISVIEGGNKTVWMNR